MSAVKDCTAPAAPERHFAFVAPYSTVHAQASDVADHVGMRASQLAALLHVLPTTDYSAQMILLAARLAHELDEQVKRGEGESLIANQLAELLLRVQGEDGPCHLLWLCQQIADELAAAIQLTTEQGGKA